MTASPRFQLASIFACYAVAGLYWGAYVATLPAFKALSGLDESGFGLLLPLITVGGILAMQLLGRFLHEVEAWAIPACLLVMGLSLGLFALAEGPVMIGLALFLTGAGSGALDISLNMRVARIEQDQGVRLFNRVHALFPFAMLLTSAAIGLAREAGATPAMIFPPILLAFLLMAAVERRAGRHQRPDHDAATEGRIGWPPVLVVLGGLAALGAMMEGGSNSWSAIYVEDHLGSGPAISGLAAAALTLGLTVGRLAAHQVEDRFRDMGVLRMAALGAVPAFLILAALPYPAAAVIGLFLAGLGIGPIEPAVFRSVTRRHEGAARGPALAKATGLAYAGYLLAPPVLGQVIHAGGWPAAWALLGLLGLAASALTLRVPPARR